MTARRRQTNPTPTSDRITLPDTEAAVDADASVAALGRMEVTLRDVQHTLAIQFQRIASMQAELDKLALTVRDHLAGPPASGRSNS